MVFGYARVSTKEQCFDLELVFLKKGIPQKNTYPGNGLRALKKTAWAST
ncbi:hypothetical protein [Allomuricauda sp. F6463D]|nr:hypothetical protein [Muricauda sp. F6463D]MCK0160462.1 hypothetical protein [Muricauda sp. F6463D]